MAVSPTPQQQEYGNDSATEGRLNDSEASGTPGGLSFYVWMNVFSLLVASLGLLGNGTVLWLLGFRIRRNPFSVYILNLAGADALFLCCSFLDSMDMFVRHFGFVFKYLIMHGITNVFYTVCLSLLAAISTERCLSALFPIWYRCHRPKHTSASVCAGIWALTGTMQVTEIVSIYYVDSGGFYMNFLIFYTVWFLFLTCILCVSSLTLLLRVQCSSQRRQSPRLFLLVLLTVLVFLLCGLPWGMENFIYNHFGRGLMPPGLSQFLACVNSCMNPFIYFFLGKQGHKGRESLRLVLQRALGEEQEVGGGRRDIPHSNTQETSL